MNKLIIIIIAYYLYGYAKLTIFAKLSGVSFEKNIRNFLLLFLFTLVFVINGVLVGDSLRFFFSYLFSLCFFKVILKINYQESIFYCTIIQFFSFIIQIPCRFLMVNFIFPTIFVTNSILLQKTFISLIYTLILYLIFCKTSFYRVINNLKDIFYYDYRFYIVCIPSLLLVNAMQLLTIGLDYKVIVFIFLVIITVQLFLLIILAVKIFGNIDEKKFVLADYADLKEKYNKTNLEYRTLRHNLINDLLAIRASTPEQMKNLVDTMISKIKEEHEISKNPCITSDGLEGIVDLKLLNVHKKGIFYNKSIDLGDDSVEYSPEKYLKICEAVGILLDNAIEAAQFSNEKIIDIDIHYDKKLIIKIVNSFNNIIDVDRVTNLDYSTKNRKSGIGLSYIKSLKKYNIKMSILIKESYYIATIIV